jgi:hypothetical protein
LRAPFVSDPKEQTQDERICAESRDSHVLV